MIDGVRDRLEEYRERAERKRDELTRALESGDVADPFSAGVLGYFLVSLLISTATAVGTALLTRALTPRQKFTTGQLQGTLQVPQSDQGLPIVEGYGADPASKASAFQTSHAYALEDRVTSGGYFYVVTTAGTSAGTAPTFPATKGATVTSGAATFTNYGRTGGGFKLPMLIVYASSIRKHVTKTTVKGGGKGPKPAEQTEISYDLDIAVMPGRGPLRVKRLRANTDTIYQNYLSGPTGIPDPGIPPDDPYDHDAPHSPNTPYLRPTDRFSGELAVDGTGSLSGTVQAGGYAGVAIYPGNTSQLPDPTIEAAIDAQYGADSTPAFWNRCFVVLSNFYLTKYGGAIPLISTLAEHESLDTLELIFDHFCGRVGVLESGDYDFSGVRRVFVRGFPVTPPYNPADVMEELARVFNVYFWEDSKIRARVRGSQSAVAALTSANIGWVDGEADDEEQELGSLDWDIATETEIARRYEITAVDPDRDFEQNSQGTSRQITSSEKTEKIELALTLFPEEMREVTQRELYEEEVQSTKHSLQIDWTYLWLMPGDSITVAEDDGTTSRIFVESIKPNVGVIPVEGSAEELAVYSQPVSTSGGGVFEIPPVAIPGQTLVGFWDGPLLTDAENSINNGAGFYAWAVKRRGDGDFTGSALYVDRGLGYELLAVFEKEAVYGVTASVLTATTSAHKIVADSLTVDLHPDDTLESYTESDLWAGAGDCIVGDEVCQILTATREPDTVTYPNRWYLTIGLRARRGTDFAINDHASGERFVFLDDAVQFVPVNINEANIERDYIMVSAGQSQDDAAVVSKVCVFGGLKYPAPIHLTRSDDADFNATIEWSPRLRLGHGIHNGLSGFDDRDREVYDIEFWNAARTTLMHSARVEGMIAEAVVTEPAPDYNDTGTPTNGREIGTKRIPSDDAFLFVRQQQVQTEPQNYGLVDYNGVGYYDPGDGSRIHRNTWLVSVYVDPTTGLNVAVTGGVSFQQGVPYIEDTADVLIEIKHGRLLFYLNRNQGGDAPLFTLSYPTLGTRDLRGYFYKNIGGEGTTHRTQGRLQRHYIYSAVEQIEDFGSTQNPLYVSVYRVDERIGRGYPAEATLSR